MAKKINNSVFNKNNYERSSNYRREFFKYNKGYKKNGVDYHCAYCGKKLDRKSLQVDHVISVYSAKNRLGTRIFMKFLGINSVNDPKNLVASCPRCNKKKSKHGGGWITSGFLGRNIWYWRVRRFVIFLIIAFVIYFLYSKKGCDFFELWLNK